MTTHCQICERAIKAKSGRIAHHGYTRPHIGWQTQSCPGAKALPFEVSRDVLGRHIESVRAQLCWTLEHRTRIEADQDPVAVSYHKRDRSQGFHRSIPAVLHVTPETFEEVKAANAGVFLQYSVYSYEKAKESHLRRLGGEITALRDYTTHQQARFDAWKAPTHKVEPSFADVPGTAPAVKTNTYVAAILKGEAD